MATFDWLQANMRLRREYKEFFVDESSQQFPERVSWPNNTADVLILDPFENKAADSLLKRHINFNAAKAGNAQAAANLINDLFQHQHLKYLEQQMRGESCIIVPVHAFERDGVNAIPMAMGLYLNRVFHLPLATNIFQLNKVGHTKASNWHRIAHQALYKGTVYLGAKYFLLDDFIGQGGTLANLRGFIESRGGIVVGMAVMTGAARSAKIAIDGSLLNEMRSLYDSEFEGWWREVFHFGFDCLTQSETRVLLAAKSDQRIRDQIARAVLPPVA